MPKLRVGVFMGGKSIEKEVSFNSGRTVCDHLDTTRYNVIPIYQTSSGQLYLLPWKFLHRGKTTDFEHRLDQEAQSIVWDEVRNAIDFMYIAMHGRYAEDGILQGTLELLNIPYLGSSRLASALCMDKHKVKTMLAFHGIRVPRDITLSPEDLRQQTTHNLLQLLKKKRLNAPWIIKPHNEGSSIGIAVIHDEHQLLAALTKASTIHPEKPQTVIVEEYVSGMEFSCITLFDYRNQQLLPLMPTEIVPDPDSEFFNYEQKYMPGRATKYTPPRCSKETIKKIQDTCCRITELLDIKTLSRIDGFVTKTNDIVIIDPNTFSGMAPSSFVFREAAEMGISHTQLINHLIETDLAHYHILEKIEREEQKQRVAAMKKKIRVGVLMGGASHEREISLESGRNVVFKLSPEHYSVTPLFVNNQQAIFQLSHAQLVKNSTAEVAETLQKKQPVRWHDLKKRFDFIFIALHGGAGENGSVQGMLEMLDIPYNGSSVFASALCMDKFKTAQFLHASGFAVPTQMRLSKKEWLENKKKCIASIQRLGAPYIIKPLDDGCSVMVQKVHTEKEITVALDQLFAQKEAILIEEYIAGMELTVGVIGNDHPQALPPSYAITHQAVLSIEEKFLPGAGENQTPAPLPTKTLGHVQRIIEQVYKAVNCRGYARIDCFYQTAEQSPTKSERVIILEINTLPGLTPATCIFHQAAEIGLKPMEFINKIVELGMEAHSHASKPIEKNNLLSVSQ